MKRFRSFHRGAWGLLVGSFGWSLLASAWASPLPGDVDGNGVVSLADVTLVLRAAVGLQTLGPDQASLADVAPRPGMGGRLYGDGRVTLADATRLLQYVVGLLPYDELAPAEPQTLYTLNAGPQCKGPATVSTVDLSRLFSAPQTAVTLNAFDAGDIPDQMVIQGGSGYLVNSGANTLQIIDLPTSRTTGTIDLGVGTNPLQVAVVGNKAYVTLLATGDVAVVDLATRQVTQRIATGSGPTGILAAAGKVYATNTAFEGYNAATMTSQYGPGTVSIIDPAKDIVIGTLSVPTNPQALALDPLGRLHVVSTGDFGAIPGVVTVFDPRTDQPVGTVAIGGTPAFLTITFQGKAYLGDSSNGVTVYDAGSLAILRGPKQAIPITPYAWDVASDSRGRVYIDDLSADKVVVLDSLTDATLGEVAVGPCPEALAVR